MKLFTLFSIRTVFKNMFFGVFVFKYAFAVHLYKWTIIIGPHYTETKGEE